MLVFKVGRVTISIRAVGCLGEGHLVPLCANRQSYSAKLEVSLNPLCHQRLHQLSREQLRNITLGMCPNLVSSFPWVCLFLTLQRKI